MHTARLLVSGYPVEDIQFYGRTSYMLSKFDVRERNQNDTLEQPWNVDIPATKARRFIVDLRFGVLNEGKALSLSWSPLTLELTLGGDPSEYLRKDLAAQNYNRTNWVIDQVSILAETMTISPDLTEKWASHLAREGTLSIPFTAIHNSLHVPPNQSEFDILATRALSKIRSVLLSFFAPAGAGDANVDRVVNTFLWNPLSGAESATDNDTLQLQVSLGSKVWPTHPTQSVQEIFYHLRNMLDLSRYGQIDITRSEWLTDAFCFGMDFERAGGTYNAASFTGHSSKDGSPIIFHVRNWPGTVFPTRCFVTIIADSVLVVSQAGASLAD
jgi:hypothetical protein